MVVLQIAAKVMKRKIGVTNTRFKLHLHSLELLGDCMRCVVFLPDFGGVSVNTIAVDGSTH